VGYEISEKLCRRIYQYYYEIRLGETNIGIFYDKLSYPINSIINGKYVFLWLETEDVISMFGTRISYLRKGVNNQCLDLQKQNKMRSNF